MDTMLDILLVWLLVGAAMATVMTPRILWSVIGLAVTSAVLTILMFRFDSPLAAVFELSVCAGLIPAIFISTISLTQRLSPEGMAERRREKWRRFGLLPVLVILVGVALMQVHIPLDFVAPPAAKETDVRNVLWHVRHIDLVGQIAILLGGAWGVVVLLKERKRAA
jgi:NADH-quinone oxidoreductase subunit J